MNLETSIQTRELLADEDEPTFEPFQILLVLREKLWLIVLFGLLAVFGGFAYAKRMPRTYRATAILEINSPSMKVVPFVDEQAPGPTMEAAGTIVAIFGSRAFLQHVVEDNHLLEDPEFLPLPPGSPPLNIGMAVNALASMESAQARPGTSFIEVSAQHANPRMAQKLADALANGYIRLSIRQRAASSEMAIEFLVGEAVKLKDQVTRSEQALQDYIRKTKSTSLREKEDTVFAKFKSLNDQLLTAKSSRIRLEADVEEIRKVASQPQAMLDIASVATHPSIVAAKQQISSLEEQISTLSLRYTEKHPKMIEARHQLADAKAELADSLARMPTLIKSNYETAIAMEHKFELALSDQEKATMELNDQAIPYNVLTREVDTNHALYDSILMRLKQTEISKGIEMSNMHIFEAAILPITPIQPSKLNILAIALGIGIVIGTALAFGLDALDSSVKTVEQAERITNLKVIGAIPRGLSRDSSDSPLAFHKSPASSVAEGFRSLRTGLQLVDRALVPRVVLFTSANPDEGKTFCAINYATSVARQGLQTLLIDADFRAPMVEQLLMGDTSHPGLSDYLDAPSGAGPCIYPMEFKNLSVLTAGTPFSNPAELLSNPAFAQIIDSLRKVFHCIVIDTAPLLAISDTLLLLRHSDSVCLVANAGKTPRKEILRAIQIVTQASGKTPNLVLNRLPYPRSVGRYSDRYRAARLPNDIGGRKQSEPIGGPADAIFPPG